ncbi:Electron transporter [Citrus sinensis]|uniref:Electron transporter n=1 Tax=Citrus sinensis TaxID=2711 RepID=A0ACB8M7F8_CITSI|nr:Electron transporter [Citrus sinensis]
MDLWTVHVKNASLGPPVWMRICKPGSSFMGKVGVFEINVLKRRLVSSHTQNHKLLVTSMAKKNHDSNPSSPDSVMEVEFWGFRVIVALGNGDRSSPEGDNLKRNNSSDNNKSNDTASQKSPHINLDWREFRANLFAREQAEKSESDTQNQGGSTHESKPLGLKWAHPIPVPETGCVLVATAKLDGIRTFERTVVLLLRSGTRHPQEGPFGVVINRPLHKKIKHMKPTNHELATTFADCSLHFGGPLEASMFLLKTGQSKLPGFEEVIPGLCFGARNSLDEAAALVKKGVLKPQDFRFFVGYAGWQLDQLREEIESDYWYVAACSSDLICGATSDTSSESLWEEILQLMGGHYSELSRKPKQDM